MSDVRVAAARAETLEVIILLLIALEIVMGLPSVPSRK
jgi:hypothetical protein